GTAPEAATQTSFTPPSDLASGATYYWRVQATDSVTGVTSAYSTPQSFTTVNPDDGNFRYTLVVHMPQACVLRSDRPLPVNNFENDFTFDDNLSVSGDRVRYSVPLGLSYFGPPFSLVLDIHRVGAQLSGTVSGGGKTTGFWLVYVSRQPYRG